MAVSGYFQFQINYRDLDLMLQYPGASVDHTTIFRWIHAYTPELEKRPQPICGRATDPSVWTRPT